MDLRIQRTKSAIKEAFIGLRRKKPIEKITVTELARQAGINKATFYLHYSDIYELSEEVEDSVIDELLAGAADNFFYSPRECADSLFALFLNDRQRLRVIFSGSRSAFYAPKIERRIKAMIYEKRPQFRTESNDIILSFLIRGMFHTAAECSDENECEVCGIMSELSAGVIDRLRF